MTDLTNWNKRVYLLDTNVFISAHKQYYSPDFCPGFWECLMHFCSEGQVMSIDRVKEEIHYPPELVSWVDATPNSMFRASQGAPVVYEFQQIMAWIEKHPKFKYSAKREFSKGADGWLIAYAKSHGAIVVTNEVFDPKVRKKVKIPNVCQHFKVECMTTYEMLRELGVEFNWRRI